MRNALGFYGNLGEGLSASFSAELMLPTDDPSVAFDGIVYWLTAGEIGPASAVSELGASGRAFQYFFDVPIEELVGTG